MELELRGMKYMIWGGEIPVLIKVPNDDLRGDTYRYIFP